MHLKKLFCSSAPHPLQVLLQASGRIPVTAHLPYPSCFAGPILFENNRYLYLETQCWTLSVFIIYWMSVPNGWGTDRDVGTKSRDSGTKCCAKRASERGSFAVSTSMSRRLLIRYFRRAVWARDGLITCSSSQQGPFSLEWRIKLLAVATGEPAHFFLFFFYSSFSLPLSSLWLLHFFATCVLLYLYQ